MLKIEMNFPVEARIIGDLVIDPSDLQLMMPPAEIPFNQAQWQAKLDHSQGTLSFFVKDGAELVGHFAFLRANQPSGFATLGLVYLHPSRRKTSASIEMIKAAEKLAVELLNIKTMLLNVRSFNLPAHRLYSKMGYQEYERVDDMVRMKKVLQ